MNDTFGAHLTENILILHNCFYLNYYGSLQLHVAADECIDKAEVICTTKEDIA